MLESIFDLTIHPVARQGAVSLLPSSGPPSRIILCGIGGRTPASHSTWLQRCKKRPLPESVSFVTAGEKAVKTLPRFWTSR